MIRLAKPSDLEHIMAIYKDAREFIASYGSPQWQNIYPSVEIALKDIQSNALFVYEEEEILGVMSVFDYESTYEFIEGKWLSNKPYKVIHRIATKASSRGKGISAKLINYVFEHLNAQSMRIDTHKLNLPMQNLLIKLGFEYCGIIYLNQIEDKERLAYQKDI
ncbi:GNAT family N-acetyltransferase [Acholeplasma equirhinis]|uniref:GNAT family N-acetyltransferase n=1 Tax=Acholeplasma equirhinis TaxID=555393 RepID=UPI00197AFAF3|nr:GNAT family N-acetyltransferase [Acholeplasma equirhinis]MBN3490136.1 GNAT family N-acetyltransferase [Acholeplasma equirhinis]